MYWATLYWKVFHVFLYLSKHYNYNSINCHKSVEGIKKKMHWFALDCTVASHYVASQCTLNFTFSYFAVFVAFSADLLFKLQVNELRLLFWCLLTQLKGCCWWQCQSNPVKDYQRTPSYWQRQPYSPDSLVLRHTQETSHRTSLTAIFVFLSAAHPLLGRLEFPSRLSFIYISFYSSSFCFYSSWHMSSTAACTQSLGSFFLPMLPLPSLNGNFSYLSLSKFPGHKKMNLNHREAMCDLMPQQEDLRGVRFIFLITSCMPNSRDKSSMVRFLLVCWDRAASTVSLLFAWY